MIVGCTENATYYIIYKKSKLIPCKYYLCIYVSRVN